MPEPLLASNIRQRPWPPGGPRGVVFHDTGGPNLSGAIAQLRHDHNAYNIIIDRDGRIIPYVNPEMAGAHAGTYIRPEYRKAGLGNENMLGVAYVGEDNNDITPEQLAAAPQIAQYIRDNFPNVDPNLMLGHGEFVSPDHRDVTEGTAFRDAVKEALSGGLRFSAEPNPFDTPAPANEDQRLSPVDTFLSGSLDSLGSSLTGELGTSNELGEISLHQPPPIENYISGDPSVEINPSFQETSFGESQIPFRAALPSASVYQSILDQTYRDPMDSAFFSFEPQSNYITGIADRGSQIFQSSPVDDSAFFNWNDSSINNFGGSFGLGADLRTDFTGPQYAQEMYHPSGPETGYGDASYYNELTSGGYSSGDKSIENFGGDLKLGEDFNAQFPAIETGGIAVNDGSMANFGGDMSLGEDLNSNFTPSSQQSAPEFRQSRPHGDTSPRNEQIGTPENPIFGLGEESGERYYNTGQGWVKLDLYQGTSFKGIPGETMTGGNFVGIDPNTNKPVYNPTGYGQFTSGQRSPNQFYNYGTGSLQGLHDPNSTAYSTSTYGTNPSSAAGALLDWSTSQAGNPNNTGDTGDAGHTIDYPAMQRDPRWVFPSQGYSDSHDFSHASNANAYNQWMIANNQWYYGGHG